MQKSGLFGGLFDRTTTQSTSQTASAGTSSNNEGFFARLFKSKTETPQVASAGPSAGLIKGAQPLVPAGSVDSRWAGLQ